MGNQKLDFLILTTAPFPVGFAPSQRIISYFSGFTKNKKNGQLIILKPNQVKNNSKFNCNGNFQNVDYIYPTGIINGNFKSILIRKLEYIYSNFYSIIYLYNRLRKEKIKFIIFYGESIFLEIFSIIICKIFGVKILKEESEHPEITYKSYKLSPTFLIKIIYKKFIYSSYDSILCMTDKLRKLFISHKISKKKLLVINNFTSKNFNIDYKSDNKYNFGYIGSLNEKKDGVLSLLECLNEVKKIYPKVCLIIIGFGNKIEKNSLDKKIKLFKLSNNTKVYYNLENSEIIDKLLNVSCFVSCRKKSLQSDYGFPTKIVEYLSFELPLLTTITGSLNKFLVDGINCFCIKNFDVQSYSQKWIHIIKDPKNAKKVGKNARETSLKYFNPKVETSKILNHINNIS